MLHCGNDIVDLRSLEAAGKGRDRRFVSRVLTTAEEELLAASGYSDCVLWLLWAAKEAAYKLVSRTQAGLPFIPKRFQATFPDCGSVSLSRSIFAGPNGCVETPCGVVTVKAELTNDYVQVISAASGAILNQVMAGKINPFDQTDEIPVAHESELTCRFALAALAKALGTKTRSLEIRRLATPRGPGPPVVYHENKPAAVNLSLSHHGRYVSYAYITPSEITAFSANPPFPPPGVPPAEWSGRAS